VSVPIFTPRDDLLAPADHARGPWDPGAQHGGAPSALLVRAVERVAPDGLRVARLTVEFLGAVPLAPVRTEAAIVRPGRRFAIAEAELAAADGRALCRARAMLLRRDAEPPTPDAGALAPPLAAGPGAADGHPFPMLEGEGFGTTALELRRAAGTRPGPMTVWFRLRRPLVAGEEPSPAQRAAAVADFGNGISAEVDWDRWLFVNTDLTVHLVREPRGEWLALAARTRLDPGGAGLATSVLHDEDGPVGTGAQSLFVSGR
jgi:hypothetical protein